MPCIVMQYSSVRERNGVSCYTLIAKELHKVKGSRFSLDRGSLRNDDSSDSNKNCKESKVLDE